MLSPPGQDSARFGFQLHFCMMIITAEFLLKNFVCNPKILCFLLSEDKQYNRLHCVALNTANVVMMCNSSGAVLMLDDARSSASDGDAGA